MLIEYEFYYNLENMITKPRNFTKIAGRITRIITNKELSIFNLLNKGDIVGITITHDSSNDMYSS